MTYSFLIKFYTCILTNENEDMFHSFMKKFYESGKSESKNQPNAE